MKIITEQILEQIIQKFKEVPSIGSNYDDAMVRHEVKLLQMLKREAFIDIDQLTVTKLTPMSEAPRDGSYIKVIFWSGTNQGHSEMFVCWNKKHESWEEYNLDPEEETFKDFHFNGWIPLPIYKPEQP